MAFVTEETVIGYHSSELKIVYFYSTAVIIAGCVGQYLLIYLPHPGFHLLLLTPSVFTVAGGFLIWKLYWRSRPLSVGPTGIRRLQAKSRQPAISWSEIVQIEQTLSFDTFHYKFRFIYDICGSGTTKITFDTWLDQFEWLLEVLDSVAVTQRIKIIARDVDCHPTGQIISLINDYRSSELPRF